MNLHNVATAVTVTMFLLAAIVSVLRLLSPNSRGMGHAALPLVYAAMLLIPLNMAPTFMSAVSKLATPHDYVEGQPHIPGGLIDHLFDTTNSSETSSAAPTTSAQPAPAAAPASSAPAPTTPVQPSSPTDWTPLVIALAVAAAGGGLTYAGYKTWSAVQDRRHRKFLRDLKRQGQIDRWQIGVASFNAAAEALVAFETDPESVYFTRPLLSDTDEPATAAFHTAFGAAQGLKLETVPTDDTAIAAFVDAAAAAERAFNKADENARRKARIGIVHNDRRLTDPDKRKLEQARKLLSTATHPGTSPTEAQAAHNKALLLLDDVGLVVPERLVTNIIRSIETVQRQAITV